MTPPPETPSVKPDSDPLCKGGVVENGLITPPEAPRARRYLGEEARIAVMRINASFDRPPIVPDGDGWWLAPRARTEWDRAISAPTYLRWSDETVIEQAAMHEADGMLVDAPLLTDNRDIRL